MGKDQAYYFSHDSNARNDFKIKALRKKYKSAGYGNYWIIIELMREAAGHKLPLDEITISALSDEFKMKTESTRQFINDCIHFTLFRSGDGFFWSESLFRRMAKRQEIHEKFSEAGKAGASKRWPPYSQAIASDSHPIAIDSIKEKKIEEKENKKKIEERADKPPPAPTKFAKPTKEDLTNYFSELGLNDFSAAAQADLFLNHYNSNGWRVGRSAMKDWKASAGGWKLRMNEFSKQDSKNGTHKNPLKPVPQIVPRGGFGKL